jgi:hypothetical protein
MLKWSKGQSRLAWSQNASRIFEPGALIFAQVASLTLVDPLAGCNRDRTAMRLTITLPLLHLAHVALRPQHTADQITQRPILLPRQARKPLAQLGLNSDAQLRLRFCFHARDSAGPAPHGATHLWPGHGRNSPHRGSSLG